MVIHDGKMEGYTSCNIDQIKGNEIIENRPEKLQQMPEKEFSGYDIQKDGTSDTISIAMSEPRSEAVDMSEILLLAWVLLLRRYNGNTEIHFSWGYEKEISENAGSTCSGSLELSRSQQLSEVLNEIRVLRGKLSVSVDKFTEPNGGYMFLNNSLEALRSKSHGDFQIEIKESGQSLYVKPFWRSTAMSKETAMVYANSFMDILKSILQNRDQQVSNFVDANPHDLETIWKWNETLPPTIRQCMHEIIAAQARVNQDKIAIESWDGQLTYRDIEKLSTQLAGWLLGLGLELDVIPLCFEKSMWTVVAVLGVMKAGAGFALMDPSQPQERLRTIVAQVNAKVILTSRLQQDLASTLAEDARLITVTRESLQDSGDIILPPVLPSAKLYVQFTSGSTGQPKGVVISHEQYTSGAMPRSEIVGYVSTSRVLDFASYAFDVSIDCMLCTLARGGTICVPSDEARINNLGGTIRSMNVNMAHMTPSVARVLDTEVLSSLAVLGLGGETVTSGDAAAWSKLTRIIIAYGPSECTVGCTVNGNVVPGERNPNIGRGVGGTIWIVDPEDQDRLVPVGGIGELFVEGPVVGDGYLNDPEKTSAIFISDPAWLLSGAEGKMGRSGRLYKTGDLVRYDHDGTITFVGRKDTQVKLRGQRIELSEVEHHLRLSLPIGAEVAAEVITLKSQTGKPILVAFIAGQCATQPKTNGNLESLEDSPSLSFPSGWLADLESKLTKSLPIYMVPSAYIPVHKMPMMVSGKLDRKKLREIGSALSPRKLAALRNSEVESRSPESEIELALQEIWSVLLGLEKSSITASDNFFGLGADSILVMRLVSSARAAGYSLQANDVFQHPNLSDMALLVTKIDAESNDEIQPFSMVPEELVECTKTEAATLCGIEVSSIEDIFGCTPLQEGLMALSAKRSDAYVAQRVVEIPDEAAEKRLREAWEVTVDGCSVLRTRIFYSQTQGLLQVIVKGNITWLEGSNLEQYMTQDRQITMQLGTSLARYAIVADSETGRKHFVWTIHHALYDGWSMALIMDRVNRAYNQLSTTRTADFKSFIKYLNDMDRNASNQFWLEKLEGTGYSQFPDLPSKGYDPQADSLLERRIPLFKSKNINVTASTIIRAAWTLVTAQVTASLDVVFGETLIGRNVPVVGVDEIEGPMITTVPVRIQINRIKSTLEFLHAINNDAVIRIPHEHLGLQHIRRLSPDAQIACDLRTGLIIQPGQVGNPGDESFGGGLAPVSDAEAAAEALKFNSYALMLVCSLETDGFLVMASFDSKVIDVPQMERVLKKLDDTVQMLCRADSSSIAQILDMKHDMTIQKSNYQVLTAIPQPPQQHKKAQLNSIEAESTMERKLRTFWSTSLGVKEDEINKTDHFFSLGADSISAMKLVAAVRLENLTLTVADIFKHPILSDMAHVLEASAPEPERKAVAYTPLSGLEIAGKESFIATTIRPALADPSWEIEDVLASTDLQEVAIKATVFVPRFSVQYNLMYLDPSIDVSYLMALWHKLISHHSILRTVFIPHESRILQVVLKSLSLPLWTYETHHDITAYVAGLCASDCDNEIPFGSSILKLMFVKGTGEQKKNCMIMRISHAQYDGVCLPNLFLELKSLFENKSIPDALPFSSYSYHTKAHTDAAKNYWTDLLSGSKISQLFPPPSKNPWSKAIGVRKEVSISSRPLSITASTLLQGAWSLVLARRLFTKDVTFGQVVTGRTISLPSISTIQGPCDNHVPVRVQFLSGWTYLDLLSHIQSQRLASGEYESAQLSDIRRWVGWDIGTEYDSIVHHEGIDYFHSLDFGGKEVGLEVFNPHATPAIEWRIRSWGAGGEKVVVEVEGREEWSEIGKALLDEICEVVERMIEKPEEVIFAEN